MHYRKNFYQIKSNNQIFEMLRDEREDIGHYSLPYKDTSSIKEYANTINKKYIVVVGTGGSSLGSKAIYEFLLPSKTFSKELIFLETVDPLNIKQNLNRIDIAESHFIIISKSGKTIETLSLFKYLNSVIEINKFNCTIISENYSSLTKLAISNEIKVFELDKNISGRFSVFSAAGLVPLCIAGIDIDNLLNGCKRVSESFFNKDKYYTQIISKARFLVENKNRFNINAIFSYSSCLEGFNKWYVQLWAESLGKLNINNTRQALTPISLIGPVDQHSFLQLVIDGVRDKTITFIKVANLKEDSKIPIDSDSKFIELGSNYVDGLSFNELLNEQADATIRAVEEQKDIPCDELTISTVDEYNIAKLMFSYQLLVSCIGKFLQINAYDQPGVEFGKKILFESLNRKK